MAFTVTTRNTRRGEARRRLPRPVIGTIVARQEMPDIDAAGRRRWTRRLRDLLPHRWHRSAPGQLTVSGRRHRFRVVGQGFTRVHDGIFRVTPSRHVQAVVVRHRRGHRRRLVVVNVWPINRKPNRPDLHAAYVEEVRATLRRWEGRVDGAVVLGDFNTLDELDLPGVRLVAKRGLDHIYASASLRVKRRWLRLPRLGSDHRPVKVKLTWRKQ